MEDKKLRNIIFNEKRSLKNVKKPSTLIFQPQRVKKTA